MVKELDTHIKQVKHNKTAHSKWKMMGVNNQYYRDLEESRAKVVKEHIRDEAGLNWLPQLAKVKTKIFQEE